MTPSSLKTEAVVLKWAINQRGPWAEGSWVWREGGRPGVLSRNPARQMPRAGSGCAGRRGWALAVPPPPNSQSEKVVNIGSAPRPRGTRKNSYSPCWKGTT